MNSVETRVTFFADFVDARTPAAQIEVVRTAKEEYAPARDFYKPLRKAISEAHLSGDPESALRSAAEAAPRYRRHYTQCADGYVRFARRKDVEPAGKVRPGIWEEGDLRVHVNPELLTRVDGTLYAVKLWFRDEGPAKGGRDALLYLIANTHGSAGCQPAILDLREGRLVKGAPPRNFDAYLGSQADAFVGLWRRLGDPSPAPRTS